MRILVRAAASWIRAHPEEADRLLVDYHTSQNDFVADAEAAFFTALAEYASRRPPSPLPLWAHLPERGWGVYELSDPNGRVLYVGMSGAPRALVRSHLRELGDRVASVQWRDAASRVAAYDVEAALIEKLRPPMNIAKVPD